MEFDLDMVEEEPEEITKGDLQRILDLINDWEFLEAKQELIKLITLF